MIHEREPITNTFVSAPADMGQLNCAAYVAGIISGILNGASFVRALPSSCSGEERRAWHQHRART